ncbi:hypothetical protein BDQ12DRAFT_667934 [Crucibulum laeve]|uniref:DUF6533 domain-containing protein n=1 Tax=Crucibulum laeve TaxID=68775 RepID=A0A5C3LV09_9AGAR|nr:hypothetical protein BDQ12DRAFT_667934 [Crucibulum laeve]
MASIGSGAYDKLWISIKANERVTRANNVAATAFYIWDFFLTLPDEVEYFWGSRWTWIKFLFFVNRYYKLALALAIAICHAYSPVLIFTGNYVRRSDYKIFTHVANVAIIGSFVVQGIFIIRLYALTIRSNVYRCFSIVERSFNPYIPMVIYDFVLFALALYKSIRHLRQLPSKNWTTAILMNIIIRDSLLYFAVTGPLDLFTVAVNWSNTVPSAAVTRVLINMRKSLAQLERDPSGVYAMSIYQSPIPRSQLYSEGTYDRVKAALESEILAVPAGTNR